MEARQTQEPQYNMLLDLRDTKGLTKLGLHANQIFHDDPKRLMIMLSRYKFVAKMLGGMRKVLEVGCGDAFAAPIVLQEVEQLTAVDFDPVLVADVIERMDEHWKFDCRVHDMLEGPVLNSSKEPEYGLFEGAYSVDVLEHIPQEHEERFVSNIARSLSDHGVLIIGTPTIQSQAYASPQSKEGHVNCKDYRGLKELMSRFFHNVFIFSMNDEVVHTGFHPMAHYLFALCCSKKDVAGGPTRVE